MESIGNFCPVCKRENDAGATKCAYCGASLETEHMDPTTFTMKNVARFHPDEQGKPETAEFPAEIPEGSVAIYVMGETKPIAVTVAQEFILGRRVIEGTDEIVDLTSFGGLEKGVSRKHALVRKTEEAYEIVDLYSTNGTWVNEQRLLPNKIYPLDSGVKIRLGQLLLFILYGFVSGS